MLSKEKTYLPFLSNFQLNLWPGWSWLSHSALSSFPLRSHWSSESWRELCVCGRKCTSTSFADLTFTLPLQHSKLPLTSTSCIFKSWEYKSLRLGKIKDRAKAESDSLFYSVHWGSQARGVLMKGQGFLVALDCWPCSREGIQSWRQVIRSEKIGMLTCHNSILRVGYLLFYFLHIIESPFLRGGNMPKEDGTLPPSLRECSILAYAKHRQSHSSLSVTDLGVDMWPNSDQWD